MCIRDSPLTGEEYDEQDELNIYPTNLFVTTQERINMAIGQIDVDLGTQVNLSLIHISTRPL